MHYVACTFFDVHYGIWVSLAAKNFERFFELFFSLFDLFEFEGFRCDPVATSRYLSRAFFEPSFRFEDGLVYF